jgi:hypothetical protein
VARIAHRSGREKHKGEFARVIADADFATQMTVAGARTDVFQLLHEFRHDNG